MYIQPIAYADVQYVQYVQYVLYAQYVQYVLST